MRSEMGESRGPISRLFAGLPAFTEEEIEAQRKKEADRIADAPRREAARLKWEAECKERDRQQRIYDLAQQLGQRYGPERSSLDKYVVQEGCERQRAVFERIKAISESPVPGKSVILFGTTGTGKDHLMAAALYGYVSAGLSAQWMNGVEVFGMLRDQIDSGVVESHVFSKLASLDVFAMSDPIPVGGKMTEWNVNQLGRLIDLRYRAMKGTWMTMNARDAADAQSKLTPPIWRRLTESAEVLECKWPAWRTT
jgi:DNA replication protein DnaC